MMKKNNKIILFIIIIIVGVIISYSGFFKGSIANVETAQIIRNVPNEVFPGETFTVTYSVSGTGAGNYGVLIEDDITGGCSPETLNTGFLSPQTTYTIQYTAPLEAGACIFTGNYVFNDAGDKSMGTSVINVIENCAVLKTDALISITDWVNTLSSTSKNLALQSIVQWASRC